MAWRTSSLLNGAFSTLNAKVADIRAGLAHQLQRRILTHLLEILGRRLGDQLALACLQSFESARWRPE